jgi:AGZA family xanthine/uracil permease-like MFS transporter
VVKATSVGIGLFITFIGLKNLGLVVASEATLVKLGPLHGPVLAGLFGLVLTIFLERVRVRGSILIGIAGSTLLGFCMGYVKAPTALVNLSFDVSAIFMKLDILSALKWGFAGAIFSLIFADMFDSVGTIVACQKEAGLVEDDGSVRDFGRLLTADALAAAVGALFGTSTTTAYIESGTGIEAGGRTGMTSLVTAALFLLSILFVPVIAMVPGFATAPALVIVGLFMIRHVREIDFGNLEEGFPAFMTIIMMPLTYSISTGLAFGFISHTLLKVLLGRFRDVGIILAIVTAFSILSLVLQ